MALTNAKRMVEIGVFYSWVPIFWFLMKSFLNDGKLTFFLLKDCFSSNAK